MWTDLRMGGFRVGSMETNANRIDKGKSMKKKTSLF